jgi:hypothetical protein
MPSQSVAPSWPQAVHRSHRLSLSLEESRYPRMTGTAQAMVRAPRRVQHGWGELKAFVPGLWQAHGSHADRAC